MQRSTVRTDPEYVAISVRYRFVDGYHIFTSPDVRGLYVASRDPRNAYDSVAEVLQELASRQSGVPVEIVPTLTFEEWINRGRKTMAPERPPVMRGRDFLIRLAAA
jgi:hypothetical protein